jgi:redox-sensing transcriptional repressor
MPNAPAKTVGRLSLYRRLLKQVNQRDASHVFSHTLADMAGVTAAQVRRDLMTVGCCGTPTKGYAVAGLIDQITAFLNPPGRQHVALVGVGNLGRALLAYFPARRPQTRIVAAFDNDPQKAGRVILGCRCHPVAEMAELIRAQAVSAVIIAVPANAAQEAAETAVQAGARGILNFAPVPLRLPPEIYVEDIDISTSLDKVMYFARAGSGRESEVL